jgi:DNA-binding transcriptional LysR family regulator
MDLLDKMATFVRVIEAGSFSAAAKQLRISPGAVSRQMATLEADVRAELILRSTRRMTITEAGRRYYERCLRILREVDEARGIGRGDQIDGALQVSAAVPVPLWPPRRARSGWRGSCRTYRACSPNIRG